MIFVIIIAIAHKGDKDKFIGKREEVAQSTNSCGNNKWLL